jgi:hypothetical protein
MLKSRLDRIKREQAELDCTVLYIQDYTIAVINNEMSEAVFYEVESNTSNRKYFIGREIFRIQRLDLGETSFKRMIERTLKAVS